MEHRIPDPRTLLSLLALLPLAGCFDDSSSDDAGSDHVLYVAHAGGKLMAYDIETGEALPGEIPDMAGPSDMQALDDGTVLVNLTDANTILAFDGKTMLELERIPASAGTGTRPVHSYLTNAIGGKQYWVALNDGDGTAPTNSARFVQVAEGHADRFEAMGEVALGIGHHKAAWSRTRERGVISNIGDADDILTVIDYSDPADIRRVKTLDWKEAGLDSGKSASPHGCAMARASGKGYCSLTGPGSVVAVDMDAETPAFKMVKTGGTGGGYTSVEPGGRYVYSLQTSPREGTPGGKACQVGQVAVIDAARDSLVKELPLFRTGPDCTDSISGGDEKTAGPGHILFTPGGKAYVGMASGFTDPDGRTRVQLVLDVSDPADPKQLASVGIGASQSHHADILTGDGKYVFVANNKDGTVTQIDAATGAVVRTLAVQANPKSLASYGASQGPSHQAGPVHE